MAVLNEQTVPNAHWYTREGQPSHTVVAAAGHARKTTLRDARGMGLLPSVTTILDVLSKPQLERWKMDQVALAARHITQGEKEDKEYCEEVREAAFKQVDNAADLGTAIHRDIETALKDPDLDPLSLEHSTYVEPVLELLRSKDIKPQQSEVVAVNEDYGYAGTCDLVGTTRLSIRKRPWIIDFKTRKTVPGKQSRPYDGHAEQLSAYAVALLGENAVTGHKVSCANIFVSTTEPGRVECYEHTPLSIENAWVTFRCAMQIWINKKGYDPRRGR